MAGRAIDRRRALPSVVRSDCGEAAGAKAEREVLDATSGESNYSQHIKIGMDGFSGYAILRSLDFNQQLRSHGIKAEPADDGADYDKRLAGLASGELQLAAFPIDALLKASAKAKSMPATIIAVIDESRGADAVVAYKDRYPSVESLNTADTRFVLVAGSPSDTLTRVLINSRFFSNVTPQSIVGVPNEKELVARYRKATAGGNEVFVTWEPVVSDILKNEQMKVSLSLIVTSSPVTSSIHWWSAVTT